MENKKQYKENKKCNNNIEKDKESNLDVIIIDENYPGPKEGDIENAEKPGIKVQEKQDVGS